MIIIGCDVLNILIADDDMDMLKILKSYFEKENMKVYQATNGEEALDIFYDKSIDLAILDWMMPLVDGIDVCREIKKVNDRVKVLILTAKSQTEEEIHALKIGADDFVRKPFEPKILILRAKKLLGYKDIKVIKNLKIDSRSNKVYKNGEEIILTRKEFDLLMCLSNNTNMVLPREKLLDQVWGIDYDGDLRTVDTHIRRLRSKLGANAVKTYRGLGYCLEDTND